MTSISCLDVGLSVVFVVLVKLSLSLLDKSPHRRVVLTALQRPSLHEAKQSAAFSKPVAASSTNQVKPITSDRHHTCAISEVQCSNIAREYSERRSQDMLSSSSAARPELCAISRSGQVSMADSECVAPLQNFRKHWHRDYL
jgi:hypothetical protein